MVANEHCYLTYDCGHSQQGEAVSHVEDCVAEGELTRHAVHSDHKPRVHETM